eukprot:CCRYP_011120-RA/>CCRYP_011120-RA protein AED:0.08 eAED:0.08 QI:81/1/1/1/1/0.66/3/735/118
MKNIALHKTRQDKTRRHIIVVYRHHREQSKQRPSTSVETGRNARQSTIRRSRQITNKLIQMIPKTMKTSDLHEARLIQLQFNKDDPPVEELNVFKGEEVLRENSGPMGSLCFVVRRPG